MFIYFPYFALYLISLMKYFNIIIQMKDYVSSWIQSFTADW